MIGEVLHELDKMGRLLGKILQKFSPLGLVEILQISFVKFSLEPMANIQAEEIFF